MATVEQMQKDISSSNLEVMIGDSPMLVSVITIHSMLNDNIGYGKQAVAAAYQRVAELFLSNPSAQYQQSACVIMDITPLRGKLKQGHIQQWFEQTSAEDVQTQKYLYNLFQRPTFQITVVQDIDAEEITRRQRQLNPDVPATYFAAAMDEAIEIAIDRLRVAHRV